MLKINLLPIRQFKKRAKAKKQFFSLILLFFAVLAILAVAGVIQASKINSLHTEIAGLKKEKESYAPTLKKIEELKKNKEDLTRKTEIINQLKTDSSLTVRVLDEVAKKVDNQRMWLESFQQQDSTLALSGVALDNQTVAQFMDDLKESPFVQDVSLTASSLKVVSGKNLKSFQLNCIVSQPIEQQSEVSEAK